MPSCVRFDSLNCKSARIIPTVLQSVGSFQSRFTRLLLSFRGYTPIFGAITLSVVVCVGSIVIVMLDSCVLWSLACLQNHSLARKDVPMLVWCQEQAS